VIIPCAAWRAKFNLRQILTEANFYIHCNNLQSLKSPNSSVLTNWNFCLKCDTQSAFSRFEKFLKFTISYHSYWSIREVWKIYQDKVVSLPLHLKGLIVRLWLRSDKLWFWIGLFTIVCLPLFREIIVLVERNRIWGLIRGTCWT